MRIITDEMIKKYRKQLETEEKSKNTIEKYIYDVTAFKEWAVNINKDIIMQYKSELIKRYAPASVNSILSSLNSFFEFNEWYECKVKTLKIQRKIFTSSEKELTKSEYERLLCAAKKKKNKRLYYLMQTICSTGIRVSEDI